MRTMRLALTGFGSVGTGVAALLREHGGEYEKDLGLRLLLTGVADRGGAVFDPNGLNPIALVDVKRERGTVAASHSGEPGLRGTAFLSAAQADVLLEASSTNFRDAEPGWGYVRGALEQDMDVVLASKGALTLYWSELMSAAARAGRIVKYSATVGAPLPSLDVVRRSLVGVRINGFEGILNGTSNTILTLMSDGTTYDQGVRRAQEIGIAETDPTLDVDGWDAAAKVVILANTVLAAGLQLGEVLREGIRSVSVQDMREAAEAGQTIRLIAMAERRNESVHAEVRPMRRPATDALGRLRGGDMGIVFHTDLYGNIGLTVEDADHQGAMPTSMAMLRDVFNLARDRGWTEG